MKRICTSCGITIPIEDGPLIAGPVRCWGCTAGAAAHVEQFGDPMLQDSFEVQQPKNFTRQQQGDTLVITQRWLNWDYLMPTITCLMIAPLLVGWLIAVVSNRDWKLFIFALPFAVLGFGRTYHVIAGYVNDTVCTVTRHQITISHGPLPWPGNRQVDATAISELYTHRRHTGTPFSLGKHDPLNYHFAVQAVLNTGDEMLLVFGLKKMQASYYEQEIARFLGIEAPVLKRRIPFPDES